VRARWREEHYEPSPEVSEAADRAIAELQGRGSPSHDGPAARLARFEETGGGLDLELQPARWALRLVDGEAAHSISALCVVRDSAGRWLAGRRAAWLAAWAGRWALGAGGAVEVGENPAETLARELAEEWSVTPERLTAEALVRVPSGLVLLVGLAWLPEGAEVQADDEHDEHEWWPAEVNEWPEHADAPLRAMAQLLRS
jgi:8-oxo-dGTP diphosphatase